jgi:hypothetical protein
MKATIETKFEIGQVVYLPSDGMNGKVFEGKVHMVRAEWNPYGNGIYYDVIFTGEYIKDISEASLFATYEEAQANCK